MGDYFNELSSASEISEGRTASDEDKLHAVKFSVAHTAHGAMKVLVLFKRDSTGECISSEIQLVQEKIFEASELFGHRAYKQVQELPQDARKDENSFENKQYKASLKLYASVKSALLKEEEKSHKAVEEFRKKTIESQ